jgi:hypothetical protein
MYGGSRQPEDACDAYFFILHTRGLQAGIKSGKHIYLRAPIGTTKNESTVHQPSRMHKLCTFFYVLVRSYDQLHTLSLTKGLRDIRTEAQNFSFASCTPSCCVVMDALQCCDEIYVGNGQ